MGNYPPLKIPAPFPLQERRKFKPKTQSLPAYVFLIAFVLFAGFVSYFLLSSQSLRLDEAQSLWQSSRSPSGIFYVIAQDVHVPLYPLLLHYWQLFFGNQIYTVRLLSLVFFLVSIPLLYLLGAKTLNKPAGIFASGLLAASPFVNWYGNEARMYSLMILLAIANQYFYTKLFSASDRNSTNKYWWWYGISALFGIYTHYFFWFLLLTQGIFFLFFKSRFPAKSLRKFVFIALALFSVQLPWLLYVRRIGLIGAAEPILSKPSSVNFFNTFSQFVFGFQNDHFNTLIVSFWPLAVLFAFLSLRRNAKIPTVSVYYFLSSLLPIIFAFIVSLTVRPLFLTRYLIITVPSLYLFFAWFLSTYSQKLALAFKALLVLMMLLTLVSQARNPVSPVKEDYRDASGYLTSKATARDVIIVSAPFTIYPVEYYYNGPAGMYTLPIWDRFKTGPIPAFQEQALAQQVSELKGSHENAYLVLSYNQGYENKIKQYFDTHFERLDARNFSPGLDIYVYKLRYDNTNFNTILNAAQNQDSGKP